MAEELGQMVTHRMSFTKICKPAPSRCTNILCHQRHRYRGSHYHKKGDNGTPTFGEEKRNVIVKTFRADPKRSVQEAGAFVKVHDKNVWQF